MGRAAGPPANGQRRRIVVVGNGMVSHRLCHELVRRGVARSHDVCVVGEEPHPAYDRIRLSERLDQRVDGLLLSPADWYGQAGIALRTDAHVAEIDREGRAVVLADGERVAYDVLVLATGSSPLIPAGMRLPDAPDARARVSVFRDFADLERLDATAAPGTRFAILGGGLLGLETAKALRDRGCEIHVLEAGDHLMSRQLDAESAAVVEAHVRGLGVQVHLRRLTTAIAAAPAPASASAQMVLSFDGEHPPLHVDHVVVATGIRPRDELARAAGLTVGARGGIVVDNRLCSSDPAIHAIGECASHRGVCYGLVAPGYAMAAVLADGLAGGAAAFTGADLSCQLKLLGLPVAAVGIYDQEATLVAAEVGDRRRTLMLDGHKLIGATAVGAWPQLARVHDAIVRGDSLSEAQLRRFRREGNLFAGGDLVPIQAWPETAVVCNCEGVTRGQLTACMARGSSEVAALTEQTGAGGVCGACKPLLGQLVGAPVQHVPAAARMVVLAISCLSLVLASAYVILRPLEFARSVQAARHELDLLWRDDVLKQWTGYVLVGVAALGGLLSARKRLRWFSLGSFGTYRALHTLVGLLALGGLVAHTGLHFGHNLNFALMAVFVALSAMGAFAGIAAGMEVGSGTLAQAARRLRRPLTWGHLLLFWPLPLLLGLHVFAVYYF